MNEWNVEVSGFTRSELGMYSVYSNLRIGVSVESVDSFSTQNLAFC